uniref:Replication initiator protein n=1 Tax=Dulem virus 207 TaxID=3145684 RepID=A0AAU8B5F6_9VIRU
MQCKHRHFIYTIDKEAIENDKLFFAKNKILNVKNIEALGNGVWWVGVEKFCTGKWWVYYDRSPKNSKFKLHKLLFQLGYFKYNEVGCGKCDICRIEKSKEWTTKGYCEAKMWKNKCFITLTYNNQNLPKDRKLKRSDIQKFWKDLRYHIYKDTKTKGRWRKDKETGQKYWEESVNLQVEKNQLEFIYSNELEDMFGQNSRRKNRKPIRYINCGEYGPKTKRPHYHAVIFNFKPNDLRRYSRDRRGYWIYTSNKLNKIWKKGYVIVGNAETETVAYVARYCTKKFKRSEEEQQKMKRKKQTEFIGASSLGFIGYYYWIKFKEKIKEAKGILMKMKDKVVLQKIPKAMCKKWKEENKESFDLYDWEKNETGKENWKKILEKTGLTESEYIDQIYRKKQRQYEKLTRDQGDKNKL